MKLLESFIKGCHDIGRHSYYVQGAGGNISLKYSDHDMVIKSSGVALPSVTDSHGFVYVNYDHIATGLPQCEQESDYQALINQHTSQQTQGKASMETGFHAVLPNAVIHTHSVLANIFLCSHEGYEWVKKQQDNLQWIDYVVPGGQLSQAVDEAFKKSPQCRQFLLQNHGLIATGDTMQEAMENHEHIHQLLGLDKADMQSYPSVSIQRCDQGFVGDTPDLTRLINTYGKEWISSQIVFPDQAIYFLRHDFMEDEGKRAYPKLSYDNAMGHEAVMLAAYTILDGIISRGWTPKILEKKQIDSLVDMPSEVYRKKRLSS